MDEITAKLFQHTAARRRLDAPCFTDNNGFIVSTHSRPKAAGSLGWVVAGKVHSFNTQPPEGGWHAEVLPRPKKSLFQHTAARRRLESRDDAKNQAGWVSTHSRPKAAGPDQYGNHYRYICFNTQPPEGGWREWGEKWAEFFKFQHTAARRRLDVHSPFCVSEFTVSTHSRPKAAGQKRHPLYRTQHSFNTQPPEGGWA